MHGTEWRQSSIYLRNTKPMCSDSSMHMQKIERALHVTLIARGESVKIMGDALKEKKQKKCWISL